MGSMDKESAFKLLDKFYDSGGNFIDTANNYHDGQSEEWIGEWMEGRGNRDEMVIATKYTTFYKGDAKIRANYSGNTYKSMFLSVEASLKKLRTSYIDILYLHWWDHTCTIEEIMNGLNTLVKTGKVLYLGISDTPAWIVSKANQYARDHGMSQFVIYQGRWSVAERDFERDIIPMTISEGMALAPWGSIGGGKFQSKAQLEARKKSGEGLRNIFGGDQSEKDIKISEALDKVADEVGGSVQSVALAYVLTKTPYVYPIVGGRKVEHLEGNIKALSHDLTPQQMEALEAVIPFEPGFPSNFVGVDPARNGGKAPFIMSFTGKFAYTEAPKAIHPQK